MNLNDIKEEVEEGSNKRNDKINLMISEIEEENKKSSQQLFGLQETITAQNEEAKMKYGGQVSHLPP